MSVIQRVDFSKKCNTELKHNSTINICYTVLELGCFLFVTLYFEILSDTGSCKTSKGTSVYP